MKKNPQQLSLAHGAQQVILTQQVKTQINNWGQSTASESRSENACSRLTASQKKILEALSIEKNKSVSTLISDAIEFFIEYGEVAPKLSRHSDLISAMLQKLP